METCFQDMKRRNAASIQTNYPVDIANVFVSSVSLDRGAGKQGFLLQSA